MCIFCQKCQENKEIIYENHLVFAIFDHYPVSKGHVLIMTKRHVATYFDTTKEERLAVDEAVFFLKSMVDRKYKPDAYNIGTNSGADAGQTIDHFHVHLIPRYHGDVDNPRGGVRGVIPSKQSY